MSAAPQVLIVGCGLTGAALARAIVRSTAAAAAAVSLTVWDKSRGAGGRFNTHRSELAADAKVDTGAQYITKGVHYPDIAPDEQLYSELLLAHTLRPFEGIIEGDVADGDGPRSNFVAPGGLSSVVRHLATASGASLAFGKRVVNLSLTGAPSQRQKWLATCEDGSSGAFDAVVLTLPVPQILALEGAVSEMLERHRGSLEKVEYSSRYAMAAYFQSDDSAAAAAVEALPWTSKYVKGDDCIRYLSIETRKHAGNKENDNFVTDKAFAADKDAAANRDSAAGTPPPSGCQALLLHTSVPYALKKLDAPAAEVERDMLAALRRLLPALPPPAQTKLQKWRYSQVRTPFEGSPGALLLGRSEGEDPVPLPPLVLAGDGFSKSAFDGCAHSAAVAARMLLENLPQGVMK